MLNTLYPPIASSQPTSKLTPTILKKQREGFFKYIQGVERSGPKILTNLMTQGKRATDENGWPAVRHTLEMYLTSVSSVLSECANIVDMDDAPMPQSRKGRKVDSGVGFTTSDRRPSSGSIKSNSSAEQAPEVRPRQSISHLRASTLEKIAREFRNIGRGRTEVDEMIDFKTATPVTSEFTERPKGLRRIRSLGNIGNLRSANNSSTSLRSQSPAIPDELPAFNVDEMRRARMMYETNAGKVKPSAIAGETA